MALLRSKGTDLEFKRTEGGLKKQLLLNYAGATSAVEALEFEKLRRQEAIKPTEVNVMKRAVIEIAMELNGIDIDLMDQETRMDLSKISIDSIPGVERWKAAWIKEAARLKRES